MLVFCVLVNGDGRTEAQSIHQIFSVLNFFKIFETGYLYVAQADVKFIEILLPKLGL